MLALISIMYVLGNIEHKILTINPKLTVEEATLIAIDIRHYSTANSISPYLIAAVIATESSFNPKARGKKGELGLMQLRPEFHSPVFVEDKESWLLDTTNNISVGIEYLKGLSLTFKPKYKDYRFVEHYNCGPNKTPKEFLYYAKVMKYYKYFGGEVEKTRSYKRVKKESFKSRGIITRRIKDI